MAGAKGAKNPPLPPSDIAFGSLSRSAAMAIDVRQAAADGSSLAVITTVTLDIGDKGGIRAAFFKRHKRSTVY